MMGFVYLACLLASLGAMTLMDARWRLAFWRAPWPSAISIAAGTGFFLIWDAAGIVFGVFFRGDSTITTGILLAPELPLEEPVFLVFLCYLTLVLVFGTERLLERRDARTAEGAGNDAGPATPAGRHP